MDLPGKDIYGVGLDSSIRRIQMDFRQYVAKSKGGLNLSKLKEIFIQFDQNGNGQLERDEFEKCLSAFGIFLKNYEYQLIFKFYDSDKSGAIDFNEFMDGIKMPLNQRRQIMVSKIFNSLDRDGSGEICITDLSNRVSFFNHVDVQNGRKTEEELMNEFVAQFEQNQKDGKITFAEFEAYYQDLSLSIPNDDYFISLLEETWLINENDNEQIAKESSQNIVNELYAHLQRLSAGNKDDVILLKLFQHYDINKDGYIGLDEFQSMIKKLNINHNSKFLSLAFTKIDTNRSGFIEFQEFFDFIVHGAQVSK